MATAASAAASAAAPAVASDLHPLCIHTQKLHVTHDLSMWLLIMRPYYAAVLCRITRLARRPSVVLSSHKLSEA